jgi:O-methyltransferase domain/Dimerisation domain
MPSNVPPAGEVQAVDGVPAPFAVLQLIMGSMVTQAISVAAKLKFADILSDGPLPAVEIARLAGADADATDRLLRTLSSFSIFTEHEDGQFALTPMAAALRSDVPMSMRGMALLLGHPLHWEDWGHLIDSIETGEPVLPKLRGMNGYEYLAANPEFAAVFEGGMGTLSDLETEPIADAYDYSQFNTIIDVFGGKGSLLAAILKRAENSRGILVDERAQHLGAAEFFEESGIGQRCSVDATNLFATPPSGGDLYILKHIVHEWPESQALEILQRVREAMSADSKLLLIEFVLPEGNIPHPGRLVDLWLMILMGGRERTAAQYASLLEKAGFRLNRVLDTASGASLVEALPA